MYPFHVDGDQCPNIWGFWRSSWCTFDVSERIKKHCLLLNMISAYIAFVQMAYNGFGGYRQITNHYAWPPLHTNRNLVFTVAIKPEFKDYIVLENFVIK